MPQEACGHVIRYFNEKGSQMFIAMNRFKVKTGSEAAFIDMWRQRESYLDDVPGFTAFHLLQGATQEDYTLFATHVCWDDRASFDNWVKSDAFRKAHAGAGQSRDFYAGPPRLEMFDAVI